MVQNHVKEKEFVKGELTDLVHARLTNWGLIIVAILAVVTFVVFSGLPFNITDQTYVDKISYIGLRFAGASDPIYFSFFSFAFGSITNGGSSVGVPNPILLTEYALFIIAAVLPVFFKKHVKKALTVSSIIFIVLSLFFFVNWSSLIISRSFTEQFLQSYINLDLSELVNWMGGSFAILALLPIVTLFIQWVALAIEEKRATKKLVNDFKFGKKLLNY